MARFNDYPEWPDEGDGHYHPPQNMEIPEWTLKAGFVDESWHNDAAARMRWKTSAGVFLWVSEAKPEQRECGGLRYGLTVEVPDGWPELHGDSFVETDDPEEVLRFLQKPSIDFTVARAQAEICSDIDQWISEGSIQEREDIKDFADLHDFCDANGYGGGFEAWAWSESVPHMDMDFWNEVQARLDAWIKSGFGARRMEEAVKASPIKALETGFCCVCEHEMPIFRKVLLMNCDETDEIDKVGICGSCWAHNRDTLRHCTGLAVA